MVEQVSEPWGGRVALITFLLLTVEEKRIKWVCFLNQLSLRGYPLQLSK